ncbi:MAG: SDR family oxidoreductase [Bacteroidetes bacterium]|nr:SDR family oxidoreductase [Bacteroidota bacterium]
MNLIVTGASRGIGKAILLKFAAEGYNLAFCSRNINNLNALKEELFAVNKDIKLYFESCDMSNKMEVEAFAKNALAAFGHFDIVINNAGIFLPGEINNAESGDLEKMMDTNLFSAYHFTRALLPGLQQRRKGHIFNICSVASLMAYPNGSLYSITKFALLGFSKSLREEMKDKNIRVTAVLPGATYTDSWQGIDLPETRFMKASDIAETIFNAYQLSDRTDIEEIILRPQLGDI